MIWEIKRITRLNSRNVIRWWDSCGLPEPVFGSCSTASPVPTRSVLRRILQPMSPASAVSRANIWLADSLSTALIGSSTPDDSQEMSLSPTVASRSKSTNSGTISTLEPGWYEKSLSAYPLLAVTSRMSLLGSVLYRIENPSTGEVQPVASQSNTASDTTTVSVWALMGAGDRPNNAAMRASPRPNCIDRIKGKLRCNFVWTIRAPPIIKAMSAV